MAKRRQPSGAFFRRLKAYSGPKPHPVVKPNSWIRKFHESDVWLWTEAVAFVVLAATVWQIWVDLEDRKTQRVAQAWASVTRPAPGNSGKGVSLAYLNSQKIPLIGVDLSAATNRGGIFLFGVNLRKANLNGANLSGANLRESNLSDANLVSANLSDANLRNSNLSGASFIFANLAGTQLVGVDLTDANLNKVNMSGANLARANLSKATMRSANLSDVNFKEANLSQSDISGTNFSGAILDQTKLLLQSQLDTACGDEKTQVPKGLSIKKCPQR